MSAGAALAIKYFRPTLVLAGYDADEVESFVDLVELALQSPQPQLSASDVAKQRFSVVVLKMGYRMEDVDGYLDAAERALWQRERSPGAAPVGAS